MSEGGDQEPEPESVIERLIAGLEAEAEPVDEGRFSVDLDRAGAKLGSFALADPDAWTLLLVEVAALLDATRVDFRYLRGSVTVTIEPNTLSKSDLDGLSAWALADDATGDPRRRRARKQLALAYLALRAREVPRIAIFGVPVDAPAFVLDRGPTGERFGEVEVPFEPGMRVFVDFGSRPDEQVDRERKLLEARCNCSRVPVHIDAFRIAKGWSRIFGNPMLASPEARAAHVELPVTLEGATIGVAGFHLESTVAAFTRFIVGGVAIEDVPLDGVAGFRALVEVDLDRDLSQAKVLRDHRFEAISAAVAEAHAAALGLGRHRGRAMLPAKVEECEDAVAVPALVESVPAPREPSELEQRRVPMTWGRVAVMLLGTIIYLTILELAPVLWLVITVVIAPGVYLHFRRPRP
ncbi:MAG: hypothetical protein R6X02_26530 [Enhygromyxa sp.]